MAGSLVGRLAEHLAGTSFGMLPETEIEAARASLIETIGVALAGYDAPGMAAVLAACRDEGGNPCSTLWTTGERVSPRQAGFINSAFAAALDYDSVFLEGIVHSDIIIVPTVLAVAEARGLDGRELLAAIAVGNDVLCRLSLATRQPKKGWFFSSVYGVLVAAALTARLMGADARRIEHAIGLASLNAAGTYQPMDERSMSKRLMAAFAVQSGIHCGQLAVAGFEGVAGGIDGRHGLFSLYNDADPEVVTDGLGVRFLGSRMGRKPFPSCQCNHAPIEAALRIRGENPIAMRDVREVEVHLSPHACRVVGNPFDGSHATQTAAQFSVQYSVACALLRGRLGIAEIQEPELSASDILALAARVRVIPNPGFNDAYVPARVVVRLEGGATREQLIRVNRGGPQLPLGREDLIAKFRDCLKSADFPTDPVAVDRVYALLENVAEIGDVSTLMSAMVSFNTDHLGPESRR